MSGHPNTSPFGATDLTALAATLWANPRISEGSQAALTNVARFTLALRLAHDGSEAANRASRPLLATAQRRLCEPLTAMLRLNDDWNSRATDMVAVRLIERQRQALETMADLMDSFLAMIAESETAPRPPLLASLATQSAGTKLRAPRAEEWSAKCSMIPAVGGPEVPVAGGPASRTRRVLLINNDRGALGALRIYLLCAGYRVFAAANAHEALERARVATSLIDIIIANLDLTGDDDGLAVIEKARLLLGYNAPAVLLTAQTSMEIREPARVADVVLLENPVNLDELNALISELLKRPRGSCLARLRSHARIREDPRTTVAPVSLGR